MGNIAKKVQEAGAIVNAIMVIGFLGLVWLMIYGNLSNNLGFAVGSKGANDTNLVINNLTGGVTTFFGFAPTFFTITAIVLLIFILLGLLYVVVQVSKMGSRTRGGFSG